MARDRDPNQIAQRRTPGIRHWVDRTEFVQGLPEYDPSTLDVICAHLMQGVPLKRICEDKLLGPDTPNLSTLHFWRRSDPRISEMIDAAKAAGAETIWDDTEKEVVEILDEAQGADRAGVMLAIAKAKMIYEIRHKTVTMMTARIYGDNKVNGNKADKVEKNLKKMLEEMQRDGKVVVVETVEVPALEAPKDTLQ